MMIVQPNQYRKHVKIASAKQIVYDAGWRALFYAGVARDWPAPENPGVAQRAMAEFRQAMRDYRVTCQPTQGRYARNW